MSLHISYQGENFLAGDEALFQDIEKANTNYRWWNESLQIEDKETLSGNIELFRMIEEGDIDSYMAYLDLKHLITVLARLSLDHNMNWTIGMESSALGKIVQGKVEEDLEKGIEMLVSMYDTEEFSNMPPREEILEKYK